jgi:hypothetical protein
MPGKTTADIAVLDLSIFEIGCALDCTLITELNAVGNSKSVVRRDA